MIVIRKANLKDVGLLVEMWREFMKVHDAIVIKKNKKIMFHTKLKKDAHLCFRKFVKKQIISKNGLVSIAEVDGMPAGYTLSFIKKNVPVYALEKLGYISDMFVKKEYQGLGISSRLKDVAVEWFRKKNIKHISLIVFYDNVHARNVYEKWGFFNHSIEMRKKI